MSLSPINQTNLFSLDNYLLEFIELYKKKRLPTKILLSGDKGLGKSTLAFHLVNYILSINEEHPYIIKESKINHDNKSYKLATNGSNPFCNSTRSSMPSLSSSVSALLPMPSASESKVSSASNGK